MVTARRMHDLDLVGDEIPVLTPVETAPRPLTSQELIDAATRPRRPAPSCSSTSTWRRRPAAGDATRADGIRSPAERRRYPAPSVGEANSRSSTPMMTSSCQRPVDPAALPLAPLLHEAAGAVGGDGALVEVEHLEVDPVHPQRAEGVPQHQPDRLGAQPAAQELRRVHPDRQARLAAALADVGQERRSRELAVALDRPARRPRRPSGRRGSPTQRRTSSSVIGRVGVSVAVAALDLAVPPVPLPGRRGRRRGSARSVTRGPTSVGAVMAAIVPQRASALATPLGPARPTSRPSRAPVAAPTSTSPG